MTFQNVLNCVPELRGVVRGLFGGFGGLGGGGVGVPPEGEVGPPAGGVLGRDRGRLRRGVLRAAEGGGGGRAEPARQIKNFARTGGPCQISRVIYPSKKSAVLTLSFINNIVIIIIGACNKLLPSVDCIHLCFIY